MPRAKSTFVFAALLAPMRNFRGTKPRRSRASVLGSQHSHSAKGSNRRPSAIPLGERSTQQHIVSADGSRTDLHVMTLYMILHVVKTVLELYCLFEQHPLSHEGTRHRLRLSTLVSKSIAIYSVTEHKERHTPVLRVPVKPGLDRTQVPIRVAEHTAHIVGARRQWSARVGRRPRELLERALQEQRRS